MYEQIETAKINVFNCLIKKEKEKNKSKDLLEIEIVNQLMRKSTLQNILL